MITYEASLLKDSILNAETYPESCEWSKMEFFPDYSRRLKAAEYFHKRRNGKKNKGKINQLWLKSSMI